MTRKKTVAGKTGAGGVPAAPGRETRSFPPPGRPGTSPTDWAAYTDDGGQTWRWASNDRLVPVDAARDHGVPVDPVIHAAAVEAETTAFLESYRKAMKRRSPAAVAAERAEARAAHGPGVTLVNVVTGESYTT